MKKHLFLMIACLVFCLMKAQAQTDTVMYVIDLPGEWHYICYNHYPTATIYAPDGCNSYYWLINDQPATGNNSISLDGSTTEFYHCDFVGGNCGQYSFTIIFRRPNIPTETTEEIWTHGGELAELQAVEADSASMYDIRWNTGEEENIIYKPAGTYIAGISDMCATAYRTKIVKEIVEIDLATCDLESNLNLVTWPTTEAQAQYIDHVIVKRDGMQVGTADYSDGQFTDNIGSGAASRTYTLTAIATDGTECPIVSYPKETIHMAYLTGINNTIEVNWNVPAGYDLLGYNICEWHEEDGSLSVIDFVGASVTSYTCSQSQFDEGYIVVQGVEADKDGETRLLSNRSLDLVGLGENEATAFRVYPNPAKDRFTIEGTGTLTVTNTLGQTVLIQEIDGKTTIELPQGLYFVKLGGVTRKVVVD